MRPNPQFPADFLTFTEKILNGKPYFLCSVSHQFDFIHSKFPALMLLRDSSYFERE